MLLEHYKLDAQPFGTTPDPGFLFFAPTHREAMASIIHGVLSGRGFTALIAKPGMGKTTLLFNLQHIIKGLAKTAFLFQTLCGPKEFMHALLADLGIEDGGRELTRMHAKLNELAVRETRQGRQLVVVIDEAQNLGAPALEVVRMLSNFETAERKLMHVILAGQTQLAGRLAREEMTQLRQRISILAQLTPLDHNETRAYIEHRLRLAGYAGCEPLFTNGAYAMIAQHSEGIPRNINNLCFNAMSLGCALKLRMLDESTIQEVIHDLDLRGFVNSYEKRKRKVAVPGHRRSLSLARISPHHREEGHLCRTHEYLG